MQWERFKGVFVPQPDPPSRTLPLGWNVGEPPKDRNVEVIAPPHNDETRPRIVFWDANELNAVGLWQWADGKGGLMVPIHPIAWRETQGAT